MSDVWETWAKALDSNDALRRSWLKTALLPGQDRRRREDAGLLRVGPLTVQDCLLHGAIFALALEIGLAPGSQPTMAEDSVANLTYRGGHAHLLGLVWHEGEELELNPPKLEHEPPVLLLPRATESPRAFIEARQYIGSGAQSQRVGDPDLISPVVFTGELALKKALRSGLRDLQQLVGQYRQDWLDQAHDRIELTITKDRAA